MPESEPNTSNNSNEQRFEFVLVVVILGGLLAMFATVSYILVLWVTPDDVHTKTSAHLVALAYSQNLLNIPLETPKFVQMQ